MSLRDYVVQRYRLQARCVEHVVNACAGNKPIQRSPAGWEAYYGNFIVGNGFGKIFYTTECICCNSRKDFKKMCAAPHTLRKWADKHGDHRWDRSTTPTCSCEHLLLSAIAYYLFENCTLEWSYVRFSFEIGQACTCMQYISQIPRLVVPLSHIDYILADQSTKF